jgi:hypothetical protein
MRYVGAAIYHSLPSQASSLSWFIEKNDDFPVVELIGGCPSRRSLNVAVTVPIQTSSIRQSACVSPGERLFVFEIGPKH